MGTPLFAARIRERYGEVFGDLNAGGGSSVKGQRDFLLGGQRISLSADT